jgi:hypothetical protein
MGMKNNKEKYKAAVSGGLELYNEYYIAEYDETKMPEHEFSENFKKRMKKLIRSQKKPYYFMINTVGKRVASFIIALVLAFTTTVLSVKSLRESVWNFIVEVYEKWSILRFVDEGGSSTGADGVPQLVVSMPTYVPEGYVLIFEDSNNISGVYKYKNSSGNTILYKQYCTDSGLQMIFNTEEVETENIKIGTIDGIYFENKGCRNIIWRNEKYLFSVSSKISKDELLKIAESIK